MDQVYPYYLQPDEPFHLEAIPLFGLDEKIDFFYKYKRDNEKLYIGNIDKSNLLLKSSKPLFLSIKEYFLKTQYEDDKVADDVRKRLFPKMCWLVDSYFKKGFTHPITVHYNPRIKANVIHPGSIRSHVISLFYKQQLVNCLYFNTGGVKFGFMDSLRVFSKGDILLNKETLELELVADHGSIIPHINLDSKSVVPNVKDWHGLIRKRLTEQNFSIFSNAPLEVLHPWATSKDNARIEIIVKDVSKLSGEYYYDVICKSVILSIIGREYESEDLIVKFK